MLIYMNDDEEAKINIKKMWHVAKRMNFYTCLFVNIACSSLDECILFLASSFALS